MKPTLSHHVRSGCLPKSYHVPKSYLSSLELPIILRATFMPKS